MIAIRGTAPPAAMFYYSRDRGGEHPQRHLARYAGLSRPTRYGYLQLYLRDRSPGPVIQARCWVHARRKFLAWPNWRRRTEAAGKKAVVLSPIAIEAVRRIDAMFDIERSINGKSAEERAPFGRNEQAARGACRAGCASNAAKCREVTPGQGDRLHAEALACLPPVPRRWEDLSDEQCR